MSVCFFAPTAVARSVKGSNSCFATRAPNTALRACTHSVEMSGQSIPLLQRQDAYDSRAPAAQKSTTGWTCPARPRPRRTSIAGHAKPSLEHCLGVVCTRSAPVHRSGVRLACRPFQCVAFVLRNIDIVKKALRRF